jgi:hypothetical protein
MKSSIKFSRKVFWRFRFLGVLASSAALPHVTYAQQPNSATTVPIREVSSALRSSHTFANIFQVRSIADGHVFVNDGLRRQLLLLSDKLDLSRVVLDSVASSGGERYGIVPAPFIQAPFDTTMFLDREARAFIVIDPRGKVIRTTSVPTQAADFNSLSIGRSAIDHSGNLIFRKFSPPAPKRIGDTTSSTVVMELRSPPTAPLVRANFETRTTDSIGAIKQVTGVRSVVTQGPGGSVKAYFIPLETLDDWALLSDGSIAMVRGSDYHVDFIRPNGTRESAAKLPFDWKEIPEREKQRIIDSARTATETMVANATAIGGTAAGNSVLAYAMEGMITSYGGGVPTPPRAVPARRSAPVREPPPLQYEVGPLKDMPDYYPPIRAGSALADADGNLWILPATSAQSRAGELVYDVVSGKGTLVERVRLPLGRSIAGFGRGGAVFLMSKEGELWSLERVTVRR